MKNKRKALVRNVVLAMVAADAAGVYYIHDRLSQPAPSGDVTIDDETIAAAAEVHFKPQVAEPETVLAKRELPKPTFGQQTPALASASAPTQAVPLSQTAPTAHAVTQAQAALPAPATSAKPAPAAKPAVLAKAAAPAARPAAVSRVAPAAKPASAPAPTLAVRAPAIPRITFAPAATPKAKTDPAAAPAARAKIAPALAIAVPATSKPASPAPALGSAAKRPVMLSVVPARTTKLAKANTLSSTPVRKRASFRKAFASMAQAENVSVLTTSNGSLRNTAPLVKAQFVSEAPETPPANLGITSQAMSISQSATMTEVAPSKDPVVPTQPAATSSELPPVDE
ncbi:MAG: hypothetical protein ACKOPQ_00745 [Novosphingobium sp.]